MTRAQFLNVWEFIEIAQTEMIEKKFRRLIKQWATRNFGAAGNFDQAAFHQRLQNAIDGDAADRLDIRARDRLPVSDDGERFERRRTQAHRFWRWEKFADPLGKLWVARQLPAVGLFNQLEAM